MSENDNLFKKIMRGEIPSDKVYEDDYVYAFKDIMPTAPTHILIIPKAPLDSLNELTDDDALTAGRLARDCLETGQTARFCRGWLSLCHQYRYLCRANRSPSAPASFGRSFLRMARRLIVPF